jgi:hypothetical protein
MIRGIPSFLLLLVLLPAARAQEPAPLTATSAQSQIQTELRIERRLLSLDLVSLNEAREQHRLARQRVDEVLARLQETLTGDAMTLGAVEDLQRELDSGHADSRVAEERLSDLLGKLQERLRRIALLEVETATIMRAQRPDPLTGRWRVSIFPQNLAATFILRLDGGAVSGTYQVEGSTGGTFRGTFGDGRLRMERLDSLGGFDSVWEGTVADGKIVGFWTSNELVTGGPPRGDWTAVRESESSP